MAYKDKERKKETARQWYLDNKERLQLKAKKYSRNLRAMKVEVNNKWRGDYTDAERSAMMKEARDEKYLLGSEIEWNFIGNKSMAYLDKILKIKS